MEGRTALAQTPNETSLRRVSEGVSPQLWTRLADERENADLAIEAILSEPTMLAEIRMTLPALEDGMRACGDAYVTAELAKWSIVFDPGARAESRAFWEPYKRALSDLPHDGILGAIAAYEKLSDAQYFPKPGVLRGLALAHLAPIYCAIGRCRRALKTPLKPPIDRGTAEQRRAQIAELLGSFSK